MWNCKFRYKITQYSYYAGCYIRIISSPDHKINGDDKPVSPSKSDTLKSTDSASGGETLEDRSSKEVCNKRSQFFCRLRSIAAHRDHFVWILSVRPSVRLCVCLSGSHTFLVVTHSYVLQATRAFLGMLPLCLLVTIIVQSTHGIP